MYYEHSTIFTIYNSAHEQKADALCTVDRRGYGGQQKGTDLKHTKASF